MTKVKQIWLVILCLLLPLGSSHAVELTGRFSMLGATAQAGEGDAGYVAEDNRLLTADQQSLRLMIDDSAKRHEWSLHVKALRQHLDGFEDSYVSSTELFRYEELAHDWLSERDEGSSTRAGYEVDRLLYRYHFSTTTLSLGRQAIDWGSGRFWQPLNVFGAFSPTDLDTDYKPGIDTMMLEWYPSAFSSLAAAYVFAPEDRDDLDDSAAVYYRRQAGTLSEFSLLAGRVIGNDVIGGSFESAIAGMGWRVEGIHYRLEDGDGEAVFWIAGIDYQFENGTLVLAEWYDNSRGVSREEEFIDAASDPLVRYGLQQQMGRQVLGLSAEKDLTPLLHGGYTLLCAVTENQRDRLSSSLLHQVNMRYSVSNESDLLLSLLFADGKGLDDDGYPRSEFGHIPPTATLRLRFYF